MYNYMFINISRAKRIKNYNQQANIKPEKHEYRVQNTRVNCRVQYSMLFITGKT